MRAVPISWKLPSPQTFARALSHRNYRLFLVGQGISLVGTWMQQLGVSWLVYDLTRSAWLLALVNVAAQAPTLFVAPLAGVLADRKNRHRIILTTQTLAMIQAAVLAMLTWHGSIEIWHMVVLSLAGGLINAFDMPARQSFLIEMVPKREDLANAVALNSSMVNGARLVGPFAAGLLIAAGGPLLCFTFNAASYVAVIVALLLMRDLVKRRPAPPAPVLRGLAEGLRYAFGFEPIRTLLLLASLVSMLGTSLSVLMPIYAEKILDGGPRLLGFLTGASGLGALAAAVTLLGRRSVVGLGRWILAAGVMFGLGLIGFAVSRVPWLSMVLLIPTGFAMMFQMASSNTLLQTIVDEDKRGRVMSLYAVAFLGTAPLGSLLAGGIAEHFGAPTALVIAGSGALVGTLLFSRRLPRLREQIRPIYISMGILPSVKPEAAIGVGATAELSTSERIV
jgi:MFS family permease